MHATIIIISINPYDIILKTLEMSDIKENTENRTDIGQGNDDGTTISFVRVTTYTKSKVITSKTTPKKRIKQSKPFEKSSKKISSSETYTSQDQPKLFHQAIPYQTPRQQITQSHHPIRNQFEM